MSENKSKATSNGEDAIVEAAFGLLKLAVIILAIPTMLLGHVWAGMYLDRREGRISRLVIATLMLFGVVYFFFGLPGSLVDPATFDVGRRSLNTPTTYEWTQSFWQGLFYERLLPTMQDFYRWVLGKPKKGQMTFAIFYDWVRVALYFASALVPVVAMFFISQAKLVKVGLYRTCRTIFTGLVSPLTAAPGVFAEEGRIALSIGIVLVQPAALLGIAALAAWLFSGKDVSPEFYVPVSALYAALGSTYALYRIASRSVSVIQEIKDSNNPDLIPVGLDELGKRIAFTLEQIQHHLHVLGASGFGKTTLLFHIIRHHVRNGLGLIFVDLKADSDTSAEITTLCRNSKRLGALRILDLSRPELSLSYNPCKRGNPTEIKDKIVGAFTWESEYYKNAAQSFLLTALKALVWLRDNRKIIFTLDDLYGATLGPDSMISLGTALNEAMAPTELREDIHELAAYLRSRENWKELHGLRTQLKLLLDSEFGAALKSDKQGLDFFDAIANRQIVYVLLDSQTYGETAKILGKLILQDLKSCSGEIVTKTPKSNRTHCTIIVDEFADLATEQFVGFLNRARGSKLGVVIAHQEIADLSAISTAMRDQVMTNTSTTVSFIQKSPESAERVSNLAGTRATLARTRQVVEEQGIFWNDKKYSGVESERETYEYHIHPDTIKNLSRGQCVMVGKIPHAWHAKVSVYAPSKLDMASALPPAQVSELLRKTKEAVERTPTGMEALSLRKRAREFGDEVIQRQRAEQPGLRTESAYSAQDLADDRF